MAKQDGMDSLYALLGPPPSATVGLIAVFGFLMLSLGALLYTLFGLN